MREGGREGVREGVREGGREGEGRGAVWGRTFLTKDVSSNCVDLSRRQEEIERAIELAQAPFSSSEWWEGSGITEEGEGAGQSCLVHIDKGRGLVDLSTSLYI